MCIRDRFLADRYIKGECPKCHAKDQYGDSCEVCGAVYAPTELINPYSALTGATPVLKSSDHFFFKLSDPRCVEFLQQWTTGSNANGGKHLQPEMLAKTREWLGAEDGEAKLGDWDISRDAPYFGIEIPDAPGKYFYVWLDAPVGYLASLKSYCAVRGLDFDALLDPAGNTEQVHFIGKDIVYFHALFWPAMLKFAGRKTPDAVNVHGFITAVSYTHLDVYKRQASGSTAAITWRAMAAVMTRLSAWPAVSQRLASPREPLWAIASFSLPGRATPITVWPTCHCHCGASAAGRYDSVTGRSTETVKPALSAVRREKAPRQPVRAASGSPAAPLPQPPVKARVAWARDSPSTPGRGLAGL